MKKEYQKPAENVVLTQFQRHILTAGSAKSMNDSKSNTGLEYRGGKTEDARSREFGFWDDDYE